MLRSGARCRPTTMQSEAMLRSGADDVGRRPIMGDMTNGKELNV
jgi:hypothetical protein